MRETIPAAARTPAHETFIFLFVALAITDVARLTRRVSHARRDRDRDGLLR